ncbi:MAG: hypothetical protein RL026_1299 [Pseudomonadota bacterium]
MSNTSDSKFFNVFSVVIGLLVVFTILMFVTARALGTDRQRANVASDPMVVAAVAKRTAPAGQVAVAGEDNSALAIQPLAGVAAGGAVSALPTTGEEAYNVACVACHGAGIGGAPKAGDKAAWAPRVAQGKDTLYSHAINGFQKAGVMPAKGGRVDFSDDLVKAAVDHMLAL